MKVFINAGHAPNGMPDPGAVNENTGLRESDVAAKIGKLVVKYLDDAGLETKYIQSDSLIEICAESNNWDADVFVSIHCNAAENESARGTECWHYSTSRYGQLLAECIQTQIVNTLHTVDRGTKKAVPGTRTSLYVINHTDAVACLVETAFISNEDDEQLLANDKTVNEFARAIARGVTDYENLL